MASDELRDIWNQAVANVQDNAGNYFYEREVIVDGLRIYFDVDADPSRDTVDSAIYFTTGDNSMDDLVYALEHPEGHQSNVLQSAEEFIDRVESFADTY